MRNSNNLEKNYHTEQALTIPSKTPLRIINTYDFQSPATNLENRNCKLL